MFSSRRKAALVAAAAGLVLLAPVQAGLAAEPTDTSAQERAVYSVPHTDSASRTEINRSGAEVLGVTKDQVASVEATAAEAEQLRARGFQLTEQTKVADSLQRRNGAQPKAPGDFPPGDEAYHNYDEMVAELDKTVADHPDLAAKVSAGKSFEGRDIPVLKISDNVATDEDEPEVLFDCNQHAREHLTTEMCLHIAQRFTDNYSDPAVKESVDNREIWIIPSVNPDGSSYDVESGEYQGWRKNRQAQGTDINRNWGFKWGCCGGASDDPADETYRGTEAWSSPEAAAMRDFIDSRVVGGAQQIKAAVDFHTYSELVLWPFGHTSDDVTEGMTQQEYDRFARVGTEMAGTNGYTPQQSSDLYVTDGDSLDWMWGQHKILAFTFEMYPSNGGGLDGFYPPGDVIERETARNDAAVDVLLREAGA
ncbi:M14 family metallopeptidase [Saccharopolyspora sp. TS4A08]|uniref:M14 family metallopeptidase n=1 Tax=Saccharopolyspora ipomoeae TaxID=3042027 RepID=A0ABT6PJZ9_9PSEU|nr:M14 family metallopeptidase [Saccharopolyspora sp. TS4A08]MDI2028311.1 M14 family metallopeptidase [Saccharopolyspora sp. TS4A08]